MKIAFLHFSFCCGSQKDNAEKILRGVELAAKAGAEWVLTPEMALQGYWMVRSGHEYDYLNRNSLLLKKNSSSSKGSQYHFVFGLCGKVGGYESSQQLYCYKC